MNIENLAEQAGFEVAPVGLKLIVVRDRDQRVILVDDKVHKFAKLVEKEFEPKLDINFQRIAELAVTLECKKGDLAKMRKNWEEGDSSSDPSDQFLLEQEIDELFQDFKSALKS